MAKPPRSPLLGYNHNVSHLGHVFHVQTEDSGPLTPHLFTHMFFEGTILASVKQGYDGQIADDKVRLLMQNQHKAMIRDLMHAKFDERLVAFFRARGVDIAASAGALPSTPMLETPSPVLAGDMAGGLAGGGALTPARASPPAVDDAAPEPIARVTTASFVAEPASDEEREAVLAERSTSVPVAIPAAQRETRPFGSRTRSSVAGAAPTVAVGVPGQALGVSTARMSTTAPRRSPFVRNVEAAGDGSADETAHRTSNHESNRTSHQASEAPSKVARVAAADGVVVQRTVRVGAPPAMASAAASRPPRVRRPAAVVLVGREAQPASSMPAPGGALAVAAPAREAEASSLVEDDVPRHGPIASGAVAPQGSAPTSEPLHAGQAAEPPDGP